MPRPAIKRFRRWRDNAEYKKSKPSDLANWAKARLAASGAGLIKKEKAALALSSMPAPPSIAELARALRHDVDLIYEWVYSNVDYFPIFGLHKGALGTLIDQVGGPFDQADLMVALLLESGYTASYLFGQVRLSAAQLRNLLGSDDSTVETTTEDLLTASQIPFDAVYVSDELKYADLSHVWVKVEIDGTDYVFDPCFKTFEYTEAIISDIGTAMGYSDLTEIRNAALDGATYSSPYKSIEAFNTSEMEEVLVEYGTNLLDAIRTDAFAASMTETFGGRNIAALSGSPLRQTSLPYQTPDTTPDEWETIPNMYKASLGIIFDSIDTGFYSDEIYGRRLTITFNGSDEPELRLDGTLIETGANSLTPGQSYPIEFSVVHPFVDSFADQTWPQTIEAGGTYLIGNSWGPSSQAMTDYHRQILNENLAEGGAADDEDVLGESLSTYWFMHRAQSSQIDAVYDQIGTAQHFCYHYAGVMGYSDTSQSPYFDAAGVALDVISRNGTSSVEARMIAASELAYNGLEAGVLQQNLPVTGINSMQMLRAAASGVIYDATSSNWSTVNAALTNWTDSDPALDVQISEGSRIIIHQDGAVEIGDFTGGGWYEITSSGKINPWMQGEHSSSIMALSAGDPPRIRCYYQIFQTQLYGYTASWANPACFPYLSDNPIYAGYGYCWLDELPTITPVSWGAGNGCPQIEREQINIPSSATWNQVTFGYVAYWQTGVVVVYPLGGSSGGSTSEPVTIEETNAGAVSSAAQSGTGENCSATGTAPCSCDPVSLCKGNFFYSNDDITIGSGSFPYSLSFERSYNSNDRFQDGPLGLGWTHNFLASAIEASDGSRGCGEISAKEAAALVAHAYLMLQLDLPDCDLLDFLIGSMGTMWLMDQLTNNVVKVKTGDLSREFVKLVDGSYNPPPGYGDILELDGTYTMTSPQQETWNFNSAGNLATYVTPAGVTVTWTYDGNDVLQSVSNGMDRQLSFSYSDNRLASVSDGEGRSVSFTIDEDDNLTEFTDTEENTTTYEYGQPGLMTKLFKPANPEDPYMINVFDTLGRVKSQTPSNEGSWDFYFAGSRAELVDPLGNSRIMYYNSLGSLLRDINALGQETLYVRDGLNRVIQTIYPEQNSLLEEYDDSNSIPAIPNVLKRTWEAKPGSGLADIVHNFTFDSTWNKVASFEDGEGNITTFDYDETQGTLLTITRPEIDSQTPTIDFTYNARGQVLTRTDETGIVDKFNYSSTNETLESAIRDYGGGRLNLETEFGYDAVGNVISITDPRGNETTFEFDNERRLVKRIECAPFEFESIWAYNANGELTSLKRETGEVDPEFQEWQWDYNIHGDVVTITDPAGNELNFAYNEVRWLIEQTDAENRSWYFSHDALGRVTVAVDPMGNHAETRAYTQNGMLASIQDARSNLTRYEYDGFDRLKKRIYPDGSFEGYEYDDNSNVLSVQTRNEDEIVSTYDVLNRLATRQPGGLGLQTFGYDLAGRILSISTPVVSGDPGSGEFSFGYDTAGRLILQETPDSKTIGYQLDANGNRTRLTYPDSYYVDYAYDELNRLTDIKLNGASTAAVHLDYDDLSRRTQLTYENGAECSYGYSIDNNLTSLAQTFTGSSVSFSFGYDSVYQLTDMTCDNNDFMWKPPVPSTTTYSPANNLNQYPAVGETAFGYNQNGCLTSGPLAASYDELNRLTQATVGEVTNDYWHDPLNRQAQKAVDTVKTRFLYDGLQLVEIYDDEDTLLSRYVPGDNLDEVFIKIEGSTKTYLHQDRLGSVIALTNDIGALQAAFNYGLFGETSSLSGTVFGYTGQRYDQEIGLYNYKARYYSPALGRFLQPDPIGFAGGDLNLQAYVGNDPIGFVDPLGLQNVPKPIAISGGVTDIRGAGPVSMRSVSQLEVFLGNLSASVNSAIGEFAQTADKVLLVASFALVPELEFLGAAGKGLTPVSTQLLQNISAKRRVFIAEPGSDDLRHLLGANASGCSTGADHISLPPDISKIAALEEFLHGTQYKLGLGGDTSKISRGEAHVKDFMIRHSNMLGLSPADVAYLKALRARGL